MTAAYIPHDRRTDSHAQRLRREPMKGDQSWREQAACIGADTKIFYPDRAANGNENPNDSLAARKAFCRGCPVRKECFMYAINNTERDGIFGGYGYRTRRKLYAQVKSGHATLDSILT